NGIKAFALFELAAKQNYSDAQFELALIYSDGKLVPQNLKKAYTLTHKAAKKGLASAQFNLAVMFANGTGVKQDDFKASRWYQRAADQNYALAQYNLALLYSDGKGVEKSTEMSLVWNTIASWNGYPHANQSRLLDERQLSRVKKDSAIEKANQIYKKIQSQIKLKAKMAQKKDLY
ncbi:MAG: sel1 repeat family protein, partial [Colwellia sp.]|nr:sel1 repeat family protein [Colwellia sp.]